MWKNTLLQGLIALLPVFLFLVWYDRPKRTRFVPLFLAIVCGIAFLLNASFSIATEKGIDTDFRYVPLLVGSLYGGAPVAALLSIVFVVFSLIRIESQLQYLYLGAFLLLFLLPLVRCSVNFRKGSRAKRFKIVLAFFLGLMLFFLASIPIWYGSFVTSVFSDDGYALLVNWAVFFLVTVSSVYFIELGFERVNLQRDLQVMSRKYRVEVRRLQHFIDQAPLVVMFLDSSGSVTHMNDFALRYLQPVSRKDIVDKHYQVFARLMHFDFRPSIDRVMQGENRVVEMLNVQGKTLYSITCAIKGSPGQWSDGILFIGHDVTELQHLKDEVGRMERLSLVGQMAASITHEIRNPMAVIRGFVQLLNERGSAEQQSYFRIVMEELDRANGIINDFLSLAQNRIVEKESGNLHDVLNDLMPLIYADANMRGQVVELRLSGEIGMLEINSKEIKQLVLNLARNGMEAMSDNGVLRIETVDLEDTVQLRVSDSGVGIPQEKLERLFEPFYTTKTNGTGLGLALCFSIVERHNGKIEVESAVGEGTTFIVTFCKPGRPYG